MWLFDLMLLQCLNQCGIHNFFCAQTKNSPFRRVREEEVDIDPRLTNNAFEKKVNHNPMLQD